MPFILKSLGVLVVTAATAVGIWLYMLTSDGFAISLEGLRTKYEMPDSKYITLDGINIHYMDQGEGPAVVLSHASFHSLRAWDDMVEDMTDQFRIIRFDYPNAGLSGFDKKNRYSVEHYQELITQLTEALEIDKFHLIGTSSGATVAFRYAANNPEKLNRFVLINSAGMPRTAVTNPNRARGSALSRWIYSYHQPRSYWRKALAQNITSKPATEEHIEMNYDMNRRADRGEAARIFRRKYIIGDPSVVLDDITAPTLIMWGMDNPTVMHLEANVIQLWMTGAPTIVKKYDRLGHYPYIEEPEAFASDISAFLSGEWDGQLRQTQRVKPEDLTELTSD
ncbi:MAG: alpha/beta hydrolase [Rhodospirillaceae bacterium]|nr:alpha/beta hydrolase [Rhodospirillaceae bacterium]